MRLVFLGDLSASGIFGQKMKMGRPILSDDIKENLIKADHVHVNLENPITDAPFRPDKKGAALRAPAELTDFLVDSRISICDLANNHIMDCGENGIRDTLEDLEKSGISYYGVSGHPYLIAEGDGVRVALIASAHKEGPMASACELGPLHLSLQETTELIREMRITEGADFIIYNFHGGTEFNLVPEPERRLFFHHLLGCGVDVIVGHHAHVPQGYEQLNKGIIFYGLGNFVFDIPYHREKAFTDVSLLLELVFEAGRRIRYRRSYNAIDRQTGITTPLGQERETLRKHIETGTSVFRTEDEYKKAWLDEAFRVYLFNTPTRAYGSGRHTDSLPLDPSLSNHLLTWARLAKRAPRDLMRAHKRPFLLASFRRMLKYGLSNEM